MSHQPNRHLEFVAVDQNGKQYRIIEYQELADPHRLGAIRQDHTGHKTLKTADGRNVVRIDQGVYDIEHVFGAIRVTSDDPNAP